MSFLDRFFGPSYTAELRTIAPIVAAVNAEEATVTQFSDDELLAESQSLREQVTSGTSLDDVLPRAFALVREAAKRTQGMRHYDVQLIGGVLLHRGKITEMRTGEGKTLVGTLPAYLNALRGQGVHVVTVNDYLARRDAVWMGQIYSALGMSVGVINNGQSYLYDKSHETPRDDAERDERGSYKVVYDFLRPVTRKEAYAADITYGTNSEFGFDYLRDNIEFDVKNLRQRALSYAIIDEIDSILIDEARTPLIISAPAQDSENLYGTFAAIARTLVLDEDYIVDEKLKSASLTNAGIEKAESLLGVKDIYTERGIRYVHHLETAVRAKALYTRDKEYVVRDNEVVIVDEFTGRMQPGRRWSDGLHQAIEAKEGVAIQRESRTYASITYQNFFRMYEKLSGMTGTALTSQEEFYTVYKLDVVPVPTHQTIRRQDKNDLIFQNEAGKFTAIVRTVEEIHKTGQPVLIGTASIEVNERLSQAFTAAGIAHQVLNAKNHEREGEIIAAAGVKGAVTLATNMAGRGVDIKLGGPLATEEEANAVRELGGLFVLGTERHEARRIDNQLRGRSGRQGDPGMTQFLVSMDDSLMRVFGGERVQRLMGTFKIPADQPLEMSLLSKQLESAQTRIEGFHFDARKQVLAYDDVLNLQRLSVYSRRRKLLIRDQSEIEALRAELAITEETKAIIADKEASLGTAVFNDLLAQTALQIIDALWVDQLEIMSHIRANVSLRAYGQRDPLIEYRKEGTHAFHTMNTALLERCREALPHLTPTMVAAEELQHEKIAEAAITASEKGTASRTPVKKTDDGVGRNELVTITNGTETKTVKYKKAEPLIAAGWKRVV